MQLKDFLEVSLNPPLSWHQHYTCIRLLLMPPFYLLPTTHVVGQFLDAPWKSFGVCLQAAFGIALTGGPAVINADILITGVFPALLHHHICHLHVQLLTARATIRVRCQCSMSWSTAVWQLHKYACWRNIRVNASVAVACC